MWGALVETKRALLLSNKRLQLSSQRIRKTRRTALETRIFCSGVAILFEIGWALNDLWSEVWRSVVELPIWSENQWGVSDEQEIPLMGRSVRNNIARTPRGWTVWRTPGLSAASPCRHPNGLDPQASVVEKHWKPVVWGALPWIVGDVLVSGELHLRPPLLGTRFQQGGVLRNNPGRRPAIFLIFCVENSDFKGKNASKSMQRAPGGAQKRAYIVYNWLNFGADRRRNIYKKTPLSKKTPPC